MSTIIIITIPTEPQLLSYESEESTEKCVEKTTTYNDARNYIDQAEQNGWDVTISSGRDFG